jgi:acyl-CoA thioesterase-2
MSASLDHTMWFHRPVRADEWLLYDLEAVACSNARGLARGTMYTEDGHLGVSITQEALLRPILPPTPDTPPTG